MRNKDAYEGKVVVSFRLFPSRSEENRVGTRRKRVKGLGQSVILDPYKRMKNHIGKVHGSDIMFKNFRV